HDVLEEWALVRWISQQFEAVERKPVALCERLGTSLPVRRSYRMWLQEAIATNTLDAVSDFIDRLLTDVGIAPYWKDETLISILLCDDAPGFLERHEASLFANGNARLYRIVHLLRIAGKRVSRVLEVPEEIAVSAGEMLLVPTGAAWNALVRIFHRRMSSLT